MAGGHYGRRDCDAGIVEPWVLALSLLTSSLAPLTGALAAYPALASTAAQGIGVFKLATSNVFQAVGGLNQQLDKNSKAFRELSPEAKKLAVHLDNMKGPLRDLSTLAQKGFFPGLEKGVKSAAQNLPVLQGIVRDTSKELGGLGEHVPASFSVRRRLAVTCRRRANATSSGWVTPALSP
jgi:hypothetical protein